MKRKSTNILILINSNFLLYFLKFNLSLWFILPNVLKAFPETVRHGYLSCTTCHLSPSGRGILTPYGKTLSHELYSYKKIKNESESLESEVPWWQIGGRSRLMQLIEDTPAIQEGHFFPMQTELEASIDKEVWALGLSAGGWRPIDEEKESLKAYVRNAYILWRPNETWNVRAGKFRISHGLGLPDHVILVNEWLGWSHSHETQNIEVSRLMDDLVLQGSWILPSKLLVSEDTFSGVSLNLERLLNSKHKIGFNVSSFRRNNLNEIQLNLHSIASLNEKSFVQMELARRSLSKPVSEDEYALFTRFSHEIKYGLRPFVQWEEALSKAVNSSEGVSQARRYYVGSEWFPVVHADIMVALGNQMESGLDDTKIFTLIGHFYF